MNLTTDPWIPVVWKDGRPGLVSLNDAFARGEDIADLAVRPHERIALMRLLICIAQAALNGPEDEEDWKTCKPRIAPSSLAYLDKDKWKPAFELFGDGPRYLQVKGKGSPSPIELDKLNFVDAEMTTLFDQHITPGRKHEEASIALGLTVYQSFAAGGTVGGSDVTDGKKQVQKGKNGPCRDSSALHTFVRKGNLLNTVHANLIPRKRIDSLGNMAWGRPVWEMKSSGLADMEKDRTGPRSYLGRLAPVSRAVWLDPNCKTALHANGINYPNFSEDQIREPTVTVRKVRDRKGTESRVLLSASQGDSVRQPWRELHALTVKRLDAQGVGGALALQNLDDKTEFDLWVGAVVTDKMKIAKITDVVESVFHNLSAEFFNKNVQDVYELGVHYAELWANTLKYAVAIYRLAAEANVESDRSAAQKYAKLKGSDRKRLGKLGDKALGFFWTSVEQGLSDLQSLALRPPSDGTGSVQINTTAWGNDVHRAASDAFAHACPHETPRQIRAYAFGLKALTERRESAPATTEKEEET